MILELKDIYQTYVLINTRILMWALHLIVIKKDYKDGVTIYY